MIVNTYFMFCLEFCQYNTVGGSTAQYSDIILINDIHEQNGFLISVNNVFHNTYRIINYYSMRHPVVGT